LSLARDAEEQRLRLPEQDLRLCVLAARGMHLEALVLIIKVKIELQSERGLLDDMRVDVTQGVQIRGGGVDPG
jgi:hypothetical protein